MGEFYSDGTRPFSFIEPVEDHSYRLTHAFIHGLPDGGKIYPRTKGKAENSSINPKLPRLQFHPALAGEGFRIFLISADDGGEVSVSSPVPRMIFVSAEQF